MALSIGYGSLLVSREDAKTRRKNRGRQVVYTRRPANADSTCRLDS